MQMTQTVIKELRHQSSSPMEMIRPVNWSAQEDTLWHSQMRQEDTPADARMCVRVDLTVNLHVTPASPRF